jgi:hypothetical protein
VEPSHGPVLNRFIRIRAYSVSLESFDAKLAEFVTDNSDKLPGTIGERACLQYVGHDTIVRGEAASELCQENA